MNRLSVINNALSRLSIRPIPSTANTSGLDGACLNHFNSAWEQVTIVLNKLLYEDYSVQLTDWVGNSMISVPNRWREIHSVYVERDYAVPLVMVTEEQYKSLRYTRYSGYPIYVLVRDLETILVYPDALTNEVKTSFRVSASRIASLPSTDSEEFDFISPFNELLCLKLAVILSGSYLHDRDLLTFYEAQYTKLLKQHQARSADPVRFGRSTRLRIPGRG